MPAEQLAFPFPSLDFPGRVNLYPHEVAERLRISVDQVFKLVDDGSLVAVDLASKLNRSARRELRIPIEGYRNFVVARMSGPHRLDLLKHLPKAALRELQREIATMLAA